MHSLGEESDGVNGVENYQNLLKIAPDIVHNQMQAD